MWIENLYGITKRGMWTARMYMHRQIHTSVGLAHTHPINIYRVYIRTFLKYELYMSGKCICTCSPLRGWNKGTHRAIYAIEP